MTRINLPLSAVERHNLSFLREMQETETQDGFTPKDYKTTSINTDIGNALVEAGILTLEVLSDGGRTHVYLFNSATKLYIKFLKAREADPEYHFRMHELVWAQLMGCNIVPYIMDALLNIVSRDDSSFISLLESINGTVEQVAIESAYALGASQMKQVHVETEGDSQHVGAKVPPYIQAMFVEVAQFLEAREVGGKNGGKTATNTDVINFSVLFTTMMLSNLGCE